MLILDMPMPQACDDCPMLDDSGDYPMCRITQETRGYNFNVREKRMDRCPIEGELTRCGECKYWHEIDSVMGTTFGECMRPHSIIRKSVFLPEGGFCADGERKDDGDNH